MRLHKVLEDFIEEVSIDKEDRILPEDIYNLYYLNYILTDPQEKQNLDADMIKSAKFTIDNIKKKYLQDFTPIVQAQLLKYLNRGRIDTNAYDKQEISKNSLDGNPTHNWENLDAMMKKTFRSDMTRRNNNWVNLTSNMAALQQTSQLKNMMFHLDRINNAVHNAAESIFAKFPVGYASKLVNAFNESHRLKPEQLKTKTHGLSFISLTEETNDVGSTPSEIISGLIDGLKTSSKSEQSTINKILDIALFSPISEDSSRDIAGDAYRLLSSVTNPKTRLFIKKFLGLVKKDDWTLGPNLANINPKEQANFHILSPSEKEKWLREKGIIGGEKKVVKASPEFKIIINSLSTTPDSFYHQRGEVYVFYFDRNNKKYFYEESSDLTHYEILTNMSSGLEAVLSKQTISNILDTYKSSTGEEVNEFSDKRGHMDDDLLEWLSRDALRGHEAYEMGYITGRTRNGKFAVWSPVPKNEMIVMMEEFNKQVKPSQPMKIGYTFSSDREVFYEGEDEKKKAYVFDFDDTLVKTESKIKIMKDGKVIKELTPKEYNEYKKAEGEVLDFSDFDHIMNPKKYKMWRVLENVDKKISDGKSKSTIYILTARPSGIVEEMSKFFLKNGIKNIGLDQIFAIGGTVKSISIAETKKRVLEEIKTQHNGNVMFFDDDPKNIELAQGIAQTRLVKEDKTPITGEQALKMAIGPAGMSGEKAFLYDKFVTGEFLIGSSISGHGSLLSSLRRKSDKATDENKTLRGYWIPKESTLIVFPYLRGKDLTEPTEDLVDEIVSHLGVHPKVINMVSGEKMEENSEEGHKKIKFEYKINDEKQKIVDEFVAFVEEDLEIQNPLQITLQNGRGDLRTTGAYSPKDKTLRINAKNRALVDVLRTIAHELVHHRQNEKGQLNDKHPDIGGPIEDEANAKAGSLIKKFAQKTKSDIYSDELNMLEEIEQIITKILE